MQANTYTIYSNSNFKPNVSHDEIKKLISQLPFVCVRGRSSPSSALDGYQKHYASENHRYGRFG